MIREDVAKKALQDRRMTQNDLARLTGQREGYINRILNRGTMPRVSLAISIAEALGLTVEELWESENGNHMTVAPEGVKQ